mmetsp:Transcript_29786/g.68600  ORF Transcript_29786/g.68600 Transcript_29786/m.68600 type:complete len:283 (-) Transcript_29786:866-1714(-)
MNVPTSIKLSMFKRKSGVFGWMLSFMLWSSRSGQPKSFRAAQSLKVELLQWKIYPVSPESSLPSRASAGGLLPASNLVLPATVGVGATNGLMGFIPALGGGVLGGRGVGALGAPTGTLLLALRQRPDCTGGTPIPLHFARKAIGCIGPPAAAAGFLGTEFPMEELGVGVAALPGTSCLHGTGFFGAATPATDAGALLEVVAVVAWSCGPGVKRTLFAAGSDSWAFATEGVAIAAAFAGWADAASAGFALIHFLASSAVTKRPCLLIPLSRVAISLGSLGPGL